ncbi:porin family protein [Bacteroides sp.]|uniref:porin family protein n=1 Tax=Bacteroides sp. TaxID=29523 RepID=UPI00262DB78E|nr:porin family protein [Bacteroides sp.]MDD3038909.1 porin family protein [Bacteroides sp.]
MLKKTILGLICFLSVCSSAFAQTSDKRITFGLRLGANVSSYAVEECKMEDKVGFNIGGVFYIPLVEHLTFTPGINVGMYGKSSGTIVYSNIKEKDDYTFTPIVIQVPILLNYQFVLTKKLSIDVQAGPYISYIGGTSEGTYYSDGEEGQKELNQRTWRVDNKEETSGTINKSVDYGVSFGTGIRLNKVMLGVQYHYGFANFCKVPLAEMKNRTFAVNVGYNF